MSIKDKFDVKEIPNEQAKPFILKKHYAEKIPPISYTFGLHKDNELKGVCTFGKSYARMEGEAWSFPLRELNRLVTTEGLPRNALSYFVSHSLQQLPAPMVVISYSDPNFGHHGYIYQATNWIYTGKSSSELTFKDTRNGKIYHRRTLYDLFGTSSLEKLPDYIQKSGKKEGKHRYYYFVGNKRQKRKMCKDLRFEEKPYPKGDNEKHKEGVEVNSQKSLI